MENSGVTQSQTSHMFCTPGEGNNLIAPLEVHRHILGPHVLCSIHPNPPTAQHAVSQSQSRPLNSGEQELV